MRPVLRYFGGKWMLAPWIIEHFPRHRTYVEPFGGGGSVLMRKSRSYAEIYNDLDTEIVGLFKILRDPDSASLLELGLRNTPFSRVEFEEAYLESTDPIELARKLIIRSFMGFGSDGVFKSSTGFRANSNRSGTTPAHDWVTYWDSLPHFTERLSGVVIENRPAVDVIQAQDSDQTLFYIDPPYVKSTRSEKHAYRHEMDDEDHLHLIEVMKSIRGFVVLSGYRNELYDSLDWLRVDRPAYADGARKRIECLWLNPKAASQRDQMTFDI